MNARAPLSIDPTVFDPASIPADTRAANDEVEAILKTLPSIIDLGAPMVRELRRQGEGVLAMEPMSEKAEWANATALGREVRVRIFRPEMINGVYLHIHGGGWTIGAADMQDQSLTALSEAANVAVVSVDYRLAPEHPWPLPADDCETAALWLAENAATLFGTDRLAIGGESAGAHLSAVTLLRLRDRHGLTPFAAANLVYGAYDITMTPSCANWGDRHLIINTPLVQWFADNLLPPEDYPVTARRDTDISPLYADLTGLPPALFTVGTLDPLVDDTLFMAARWHAAGNRADLDIIPGGIHAFDILSTEAARNSRARMTRFIGAIT